MSFIVIKSGISSQIQDLGRKKSLSLGLSKSGAMDMLAFKLNNALLNNPLNSPQLEIAYGNVSLLATRDIVIAISGGYVEVFCDDKPMEMWTTHKVYSGQTLIFKSIRNNIFNYLAVKDGFDAKLFNDSAATTIRLNIGKNISIHDELKFNLSDTEINFKTNRTVPRKYRPNYNNKVIDIIPGYQYEKFDKNNLNLFESQQYRVISSDRMGVRLQTEKPINYSFGELISEGIIPGSVQITTEGQPIVLQRDSQSIGGYPKIGVLPDYAISLLAQKIPNKVKTKVYFRFISRETAALRQSYLDKIVDSFYRKQYLDFK